MFIINDSVGTFAHKVNKKAPGRHPQPIIIINNQDGEINKGMS